MRKSLVFPGLFLFVLFLFGFAAHTAAQPTPLGPDFNLCNSGEAWGDGRCNHPENPDLQNWYWNAGWYLPRCESGGEMADSSVCHGYLNQICAQYYVIRLEQSPYQGPADQVISGNDYDGHAFDLGCHEGLEIHGNNRDNRLVGSAGSDRIFGYAGDDNIFGDNDARLTGNPELDAALVGTGNDYIDGGPGNDILHGDVFMGRGSGADVIIGGPGDDYAFGDSGYGIGTGNDQLYGGPGNDVLNGDVGIGTGSGNDYIDAGPGNDLATGDAGNGLGSGSDILLGGPGNDEMSGDVIRGVGTGTDTLFGGPGNDTLFGDANPRAGGGAANDVIDGGPGQDAAVCSSGDQCSSIEGSYP